MLKNLHFPLPFIALDFSGQMMQIDATFTISNNNVETSYSLCGIIYFGDAHYTAHVVCENGMVWFHDGIATSLNNCRGKEALAAIYVRC